MRWFAAQLRLLSCCPASKASELAWLWCTSLSWLADVAQGR